ncbi:MAG: AraC family transcriptional regulator [Chthoniobacteraceae bacterium]|nr:AraC family transcriptional regulator [Chthoniobacteraceae bacterium]
MFAQTSSSPVPPPPREILFLGYYHEEPGRQPDFNTIEPGNERVEVVTGGRGWVRVGGQPVEVTAGAMLWHIEGDQTIFRSDNGNPYRCLNVQFRTDPLPGVRRVPHLSWWRDVETIEVFIREIVRAHVDESFDRQALLAHVYGQLLFQVRLWERAAGRSELPEKLQRALELIESSPAPLREIARRVGWSAAHLHEVCRLQLQATPHQLALHHRMQVARERLAGGDLPLKQIAIECGFSSASAFCHAFKGQVGLTPLRYRELNQRR